MVTKTVHHRSRGQRSLGVNLINVLLCPISEPSGRSSGAQEGTERSTIGIAGGFMNVGLCRQPAGVLLQGGRYTLG